MKPQRIDIFLTIILLAIILSLGFYTIAYGQEANVSCKGDITDTLAEHVGSPIRLGPGECRVSKPIAIDRPTTIVGAGDAFTRIDAPRGFVRATAPITLTDVALWRADFPSATSTRAIGIEASAAPVLERLRLDGFVVPIVIYASATEFGTNANGWRITDVHIAGAAHAGVFVRGRDSNGGIASGLRVYTSCERASKWVAEFGRCAGIVDRSFLGNTWIATLVASTHERFPDGSILPLPPWISEGASQHSVWIGPYCERDQAAAEISLATIAIGGLCNRVVGPGLRMDGPVLSALVVRNAKDPSNVVEFRAGARAASGTFYELAADAIDPARPLRVKAEPARKCYRADIANQLLVWRIGQGDGRFTEGL